MGCIKPDGSVSWTGELILLAMWEPATCEEVSKLEKLPLFLVRSAVREFTNAGLLEKRGESYLITPEGIRRLEG